ncbi:MAG: hypothetical protein M1570_13660 [Chloroflexi bacterium]|nr:hypothetical protein [Chloroflexota bacterium]
MTRQAQLVLVLVISSFLALALMALPTPPAKAQTPGPGQIEGQLVDGTQGAKLSAAEGLTVTLHSAPAGATTTVSQTTQADASGHFAFSHLDTITTTRYLLQSNYAGVNYYSDVLNFGASQTTMPVTMTVYETTTDPTVVTVSQTHFVFDIATKVFNVLEIVAVHNSSDRAFVGASDSPHRTTLILPLLAGAQNIQLDNPAADESTLRGATSMAYTLPFLPGDDPSNQIVANYSIPFNPPTASFSMTLPYASDQFRILYADVGATLQSPLLTAPTSFPTQGSQNYMLSSATNLKAGTVVTGTFTNLPQTVAAPPSATGAAPSTTASNNQVQIAGGVMLGVAALAAIGLLAYPLLRRRRARAVPVGAVDARRLDLLQEMADLDDAFEEHKISETDYRARRAATKARLLALQEDHGESQEGKG